jgi:hypothetical protein
MEVTFLTQKIKIKRGLKNNLPSLDIGEPAFCTDTGELFVGSENGNILITSSSDISSLFFENILDTDIFDLSDTTPPNAVNNIAFMNVTQTSFDILWDDYVSKGDASEYKIYLNNNYVGSKTPRQDVFGFYSFSNLIANTEYLVKIGAVDAFGNESIGASIRGRTKGISSLYFNGTSLIRTPSITFDSIELNCMLDVIAGNNSIIDARGGLPSGYILRTATGTMTHGSGFTECRINGNPRSEGYMIPTGTQLTFKVKSSTAMDDIEYFGQGNSGYIYSVKVYNGSELQAYYDLTTQFSGSTITDLSGKGKNGTLIGGTWS